MIPNDTIGDEASVQRWRNAILRLSDAMVIAAGERADLSPLLLEALNNALENLLVYGDEADLETLEEWLDEGDFVPYPSPAVSVASYSLFGRRDETTALREAERRASERRAADRRNAGDRRIAPPGEYSPDSERRAVQRRAAERRTQRDRRS